MTHHYLLAHDLETIGNKATLFDAEEGMALVSTFDWRGCQECGLAPNPGRRAGYTSLVACTDYRGYSPGRGGRK